MHYTIKRWDGKTFGPFATEAIAKDSASTLLMDWIEAEDRVIYYRGGGDNILRAVVSSHGEDTDASLQIVKVVPAPATA